MNSIVIAFGEHDHASSALRWAAEYSRLAGQPLEVLSVFSSASAELSTDRYHELLEERRLRIVDVLAEVDSSDATIRVVAGETVDEIAEFVNDNDVDFVCIGTHDTRRNYGGGFTSSAHHLLHKVGVPVLMVTPTYQPIQDGVIVVGVDGSPANGAALSRAAEVARWSGATLHAVFAYDPMDDTFQRPEGWHRHSDEVREMVAKVTDVPVKLYMAAGHPTEVLLDHAETERAGLIVVGTRGHGGFASLRLGRVPAQLVAHSTTPLLIVHH